MRRVLPLLAIVTVLALIAAPRPAAQVTPSGRDGQSQEADASLRPSSEPELRTGAPHAGSTPAYGRPETAGGSGPEYGITPLPAAPTSQIGLPASYCRQFCDTPEPRVVVSKGRGLSGLASWYDDGSGLYVALPGGDFRGHDAVICGLDPYNCLTVPVRTSCICTGPPRKVADLSPDLFRQFAPLSRGIVKVTVTILGGN